MKILFVIDTYDTSNNGTSISAQRFAAELRNRGHEVNILTIGDENTTSPHRFSVSKMTVPVFQGLMDKHDFSFAQPWGSETTRVIHEAVEWADVVHCFMPFMLDQKAQQYAKKIGKPCTGAFHIQPQNITSSAGLGKAEMVNERMYDLFRDSFYNDFTHIHVPSKFMGDMIAQRGYTAKIHVISNGIQDAFIEAGERFSQQGRPAKRAGWQGKLVVTMVGRLAQEKRQDVIINAVPFSQYADKIQLVFAGRGPELDKYKALADKLQLANQPEFLYCNRDELIEVLGETDLYIHASDMESEAISCIEAFATGLVPVIANSLESATPQFALDGRSLFLPGVPKDLARAMDYWFNHPHEKEYISALYRQEARQYSLASSVTKFEEMLHEAIAENNAQ